jgi:hypothetical protein
MSSACDDGGPEGEGSNATRFDHPLDAVDCCSSITSLRSVDHLAAYVASMQTHAQLLTLPTTVKAPVSLAGTARRPNRIPNGITRNPHGEVAKPPTPTIPFDVCRL